MIVGEFQAAVVLWVIGIALTVLALAPLGGQQQWLWLPWRIDGTWALVGAVGWGYLVCALVGWFVAGSIERRGFDRPAAGWLLVSVAISGYGGMALGHSAGGRVFYAVALGAIIVRWLAFTADGSARSWRFSAGRRIRVLVAVAAVLAGLSYAATHAFVDTSGGGSYGSGTIAARVGHTETIVVGLSRSLFAARVQSATLTGPGASHLQIGPLVLRRGGTPPVVTPPSELRRIPKAYRPSFVSKPTPFPYTVPAGQQLSVSTWVTLRSCGAATLNTLKLRYTTALGIATTASIRMQTPLHLRCAG